MIPSLNTSGYVVRMSECALVQLCLSGLEAYVVPHGSRHRNDSVETYGLLWGHESKLADGRTLYSVELATTDTSAAMAPGSFTPKDEALILKSGIVQSYWPQFGFLGDFHSHPYASLQEVDDVRGYEFSEPDFRRIERFPEYWIERGYRIGLALTIAAMKKSGSASDNWVQPNTVRFTLANLRLWLKAYIAFADGGSVHLTDHDNKNVLLDVPAILGLNGEYSPSGKVTPDEVRLVFKPS